MGDSIRVACVQNTAGRDIDANIVAVNAAIDRAADNGAQLIALPEVVGLMEPDAERLAGATFTEAEDPGLAAFRDRARKHGVMILVGSQLIRDAGRLFNRGFLLDRDGAILARYDKLHLFDFETASGDIYCESASIAPGDRAVLVDTDLGRIGLSICYDLRFAALYRTLAQADAQIIAIPAAFTRKTGEAHWHTLVRARAIETGAFVIAPNQCGHHCERRYSYGHSLIVDPWGEVLADGGDQPGEICADIDLARVASARQRLPSLQHDRPFRLERS